MGYKLLTQDLKTRVGYPNETQWVIGEWQIAKGIDGLCSDGMLHDYDDPWIATVMNPVHADIDNPVCYETERDGEVVSDGLQCGCKRMRITCQVPLPDVPIVTRLAFGILATMEINRNPEFTKWANNWLSGQEGRCSSAISPGYTPTNAACAAADAAYYADKKLNKTLNWAEIKAKAIAVKE